MPDLQTMAFSIVGAGGGGAVVAYALFRALGAKWLDNHFAARVQALKHSHDQEMAHLKLRIDGQLDRAVKLNQREFEVVPGVWACVTEAHYAVLSAFSAFQSYPDLGRMSEPQLETFLAKSEIEEWQKDEIRGRTSFARSEYYVKIAGWRRVNDADAAIVAFNRELLSKGIFLHPETFEKLDEFAAPLRKAFNRFRVDMQTGDEYRIPKEGEPDPVGDFRDNGGKAYDALARYMRARFWEN